MNYDGAHPTWDNFVCKWIYSVHYQVILKRNSPKFFADGKKKAGFMTNGLIIKRLTPQGLKYGHISDVSITIQVLYSPH